ncbi:hypothetical protein QYF61_027203 [Mycteria americana]|uniref:BMERB domain-containing protein n=1 Tax=Mycteria americana TaxID=33587 RepID=A0AAN7NE66_MYCAM|nr:hypothetical protein QYF61_027203 [Mycteria americana]
MGSASSWEYTRYLCERQQAVALREVSLYCPARNLGYTGRTAQPTAKVVLERTEEGWACRKYSAAAGVVTDRPKQRAARSPDSELGGLASYKKPPEVTRGHFKPYSPVFQRKEKAREMPEGIRLYVPHCPFQSSTRGSPRTPPGNGAPAADFSEPEDIDGDIGTYAAQGWKEKNLKYTSELEDFNKKTEVLSSLDLKEKDGKNTRHPEEKLEQELKEAKKRLVLCAQQRPLSYDSNRMDLGGTSPGYRNKGALGASEEKDADWRKDAFKLSGCPVPLLFADNAPPALPVDTKDALRSPDAVAREHAAGQPKSPLRLIANAIKRSILEPLTSSPEGLKQDSDNKAKASSEQAFFSFPSAPSYSLSQRNSNNNRANNTQPQELKVGEWAGEYLGNGSPLSNPSHFSVGSEERSPRDYSEEVSFPVYSPHARPSKMTSIPQKSYCTRMEDVPGLLEKFTFKETPPGAPMGDILTCNEKYLLLSSPEPKNTSKDNLDDPAQKGSLGSLFDRLRSKVRDREGNSFVPSLPFRKDHSPEDRLLYPSTGLGVASGLKEQSGFASRADLPAERSTLDPSLICCSPLFKCVWARKTYSPGWKERAWGSAWHRCDPGNREPSESPQQVSKQELCPSAKCHEAGRRCEHLPVRKQATEYSTSSSDDEFESKSSLTHKGKKRKAKQEAAQYTVKTAKIKAKWGFEWKPGCAAPEEPKCHKAEAQQRVAARTASVCVRVRWGVRDRRSSFLLQERRSIVDNIMAKRTLRRRRKLEKETKQLIKQEELKRLHKAQAVQRQLEELEERQRALEIFGVKLERELRGESDSGTKDETQMLHEWFELVLEKNKLMRYESELLIIAQELELEDHQSRLEQKLREKMAIDDSLKDEMDLNEEDEIFTEMMKVVEKRDKLVSTLEEQRGWRLNHFPGQSVPMPDNSFSEVKFPNIQSKPPLVQLEAISSCPITRYLGEETDPHLSTTSFQVVVESDKVSPQPPFLQAKQPQFPQPLLIRLLLQTLPQLRCPSLDTLQHLNVSLVVRGPKLNTVFEVRPHQCRVQGHDHFPSPAGHAILDTSQDAIGFLGHLGTLLAHIQLAVNQHPQVLFCQAAFQPLFPKPVALHGVVVAQVQDLALGLVKPHTIDLSPWIQPVQVPLQSLPTLKQINTPAQLGVICKLTEGALDPFVQIIYKDIKQDWPQHRALGNTACDRPPTGFNSIHHYSLGPAVQPVLYPAKSTPVQAMSSQFLQENAVGNRGKGFTEV